MMKEHYRPRNIKEMRDDQRMIIKMRGLGYTQKEIAEKVGMSQSTISSRYKFFRRQADKLGLEEAYEILMGNWLSIEVKVNEP